MQNLKILIIDEYEEIENDNLFCKNSFNINYCNNIEDGHLAISIQKPNLIILHCIECLKTIEFIKEIKKYKVSFYILAIVKDANEFLEVEFFNAGADDFISGKIRLRALNSRINSFFGNIAIEYFRVGNFIIYPKSFSISIDDKKVGFTKKEFELLMFFAKSPNKIFKRQEIFDLIWHRDSFVFDRTVDVHVNRIRTKIGKQYIQTITRVGYKFVV